MLLTQSENVGVEVIMHVAENNVIPLVSEI